MNNPRALLSVSDKTGIVEFGRALVDRGWELLSTGGTARALREAGVSVTDVAEVTQHPEMMEGRVKTLHPAVHAGILARREREDDLAALEAQGYGLIDLVAVNLYPFRETVARGGVTIPAAMKQVDIGGPTMIRSAAKNHADVWVVVDPADYGRVVEALDGAHDGAALRRELAAKVFAHTGAYDSAIAAFFESQAGAPDRDLEGTLPGALSIDLQQSRTLRYGENPDQKAAYYVSRRDRAIGLSGLRQLHGKELSYNNLLDLDGAVLSLSPFAFSPRPAVCIIKHTTPCGLAVGETLRDAYQGALRCDPTSAFGSVIAVNRAVDASTADDMVNLFIECIVAPGFSDEARRILEAKANLRLLTFPSGAIPAGALPMEPRSTWWEGTDEGLRNACRFIAAHNRLPEPLVLRSVYGGVLAQTPPVPPFYGVDDPSWKVVTEREPTSAEMDDLRFAWAAIFGVKSNAILVARGGATLGIGAGQMSRVDSSKIAVRKAREAGLDLAGAALASDAFFPFRDGVDAAAAAGVKAIVEPGGSMRDDEVIQAANEHGIAMVFTGRRLFRH